MQEFDFSESGGTTVVNEEALYIPSQLTIEGSCQLNKSIAAIELLTGDNGAGRLGAVLQLPFGSQLEVCGAGFNERTLKVRSNNKFYFVFWQDLKQAIPEQVHRASAQPDSRPKTRHQVA